MNVLVLPELSTASVGTSQAPTAAVDNSAPSATRPQSTYKSGKAVQTSGATSVGLARYLETLSWPFTYVLLGLPTLAALYVLGMLIEHALKPRY